MELGQTLNPMQLMVSQASGEPGSEAHQETIPSPDGQSWLVLYFYPKDDTPGCTKEAQGFTEHLDQFQALEARILGASKDSHKKHVKFQAQYDLGIDLVSDEDQGLCDLFGVWVEKSMYGKTYMGIERATFILDPKGRIMHAWRKVKVPGHVEEVLATLKSLQADTIA